MSLLLVVHVCYASSVLHPYCMLKYVLILFNYFYFRYSYIHFNPYFYVSTVGSSVKWCNVTVVGLLEKQGQIPQELN